MTEKKQGFLLRALLALFSLGIIGVIFGLAAAGALLHYFGRGLPDIGDLAHYEPPIVTRAYASDGRLLASFSTQNRVYVPFASIPPRVIDAFLSAEDKDFYRHAGIDIPGIIRAAVFDITHPHHRKMGGSTITQQVAKNFFLSDKVSYVRKIREAILSFRIEQAYTKDQILALYLNEIYLGQGAYGVAAASLKYFNKPLDELTLEEAAFLGALPKAPNNYNPETHYAAAVERRNWVLGEMAKNGYITQAAAAAAAQKPITLVRPDGHQVVNYPYFAEEVRRKLDELYGEKALYEGGLLVKTTLVPRYQRLAIAALRDGLVAYDMRRDGLHSKPLAHLDVADGKWKLPLAQVKLPPGGDAFTPAVVLKSDAKRAVVGFADGTKGVIPYDGMKWAATHGVPPRTVAALLQPGDVWLTAPLADGKEGGKEGGLPVYGLRQVPKVEGGMVVMDPHTGRVFALVGGFSYEMSQFDRATQAERQPGSTIKPFVYLTALENGFTPATLVADEPFEISQGPGLPEWNPKNYAGKYLGLVPMRIGLERSRNLMTIRLANDVGMDKVAATVEKFGIMDNMPPLLSMSIGAGDVTLLRMAAGYAAFANGGKKVTPTLIDRVQDRYGKTLYVHDSAPCPDCGPLIAWRGQATPVIPDTREQLDDPRYNYQIVSMLEGVVQRGTGILLRNIGRPVAGKTGTTNDSKDAWFIGFTPDLLVGVYVGYDEPKSLGPRETGSRDAAPVVRQFMMAALKDVPPQPFSVPNGIDLVRINEMTGTRAKPGDAKTIIEAFTDGDEPGDEPTMWTGHAVTPVSNLTHASEGVDTGLGGLY
ncbi:MAG: penicillin-binding protein 1A [Alphaproteobacteria bacterium]|nr:penicillin-binding protein 1A [Alphaproteobacteria bacterium]MDE2336271.1 penicillin-binding protein 1A [Alphaproteobacteria bacterium]